MRSAFDDAPVTGWEALEGTYGLPDPDDEHVVAAAVVGGARVIVTESIRHFPVERIPSHIDAQDARESATTVSADPERALRARGNVSRTASAS
jgi:hypothetical protein